MRTITALREDRRGRVTIELDGALWRTVPVEVAVRAGLAEGGALDRAALRLLRRELRRAEALAAAGRALRSRDLSAQRLAERLARGAVPPAAAKEAVEVLSRAGVVDDARFARARAEALAARGYGNVAIDADLERQGVSAELRDDALAELESEDDRAREIVSRRGASARTARHLTTRGFRDEAVEAALGPHFANRP